MLNNDKGNEKETEAFDRDEPSCAVVSLLAELRFSREGAEFLRRTIWRLCQAWYGITTLFVLLSGGSLRGFGAS
jgi:hypothetical protein